MLDRTIPFYNTILRCDCYQTKNAVLPEGYSVVTYQPGCERAWAELECSVGDFDSTGEAEEYFVSTYLKDKDKTDRILFLEDAEEKIIGSCIAWQDDRNGALVSSLHWLIVDEEHQGMGLGKALCCAVMNIYAGRNAFPVYIHTQPWSWKAILLYVSLGFKLQKNDTFSHYVNQYDDAMRTLKEHISDEQFKMLEKNSV